MTAQRDFRLGNSPFGIDWLEPRYQDSFSADCCQDKTLGVFITKDLKIYVRFYRNVNILCLTACFARGTEIAEENVSPFSTQRAKRERPNALRELFKSITACPKGMTIFLCRRLSGKEKRSIISVFSASLW